MNVTSTSQVPPSAADTTASATSGALTGSKDEFLRLFMAQLEHQDPLNPQDGSSLVAQLAQFSTVEQATQTNSHLADLTASQASAASASLSSLVGRDCSAGADEFQLDRGGAMPPIQINSTAAMNGASLVITDSTGAEVRRIAIPAAARSTQITWDGKTSAGAPAAPGAYKISIDPGTTSGSITSQWHGRIDAVELANGTTRLRMGGVLIAPSDIQTIGLTSPTTTTTTTTP
jgi:flagellar basal-body rod modification protein FlgD